MRTRPSFGDDAAIFCDFDRERLRPLGRKVFAGYSAASAWPVRFATMSATRRQTIYDQK